MHPRPNIVLVVMDTARARELEALSKTGHVSTYDLLRDDGVEYTRAYSTAPWTLPSHASLFTGTYPTKHGAHSENPKMNDSLSTLAEAFDDVGYETICVSNNTWISKEFGLTRGFGTLFRTWQIVQSQTDLGGIARTTEGSEKLRELTHQLFKGNAITNFANAVYGKFLRKHGDDGAKRTNRFLKQWFRNRERDSPFFLFVNYLEPHLEYRPEAEHVGPFLPEGVSYREANEVPQNAWQYIAGDLELSNRDFDVLQALYRGEIAYLNRRIGELRDMLEAHGEWENTVFVVISDHGENIGDHGLMDHQYCLYDTLLHVPLVIHGGSFTGGGTVEDLVSLTDLGPTLLDEVGIDAPEYREQTQGRTFHPDADAEPHDRIVAEYLAPQPSMDALETRVGDLPEHVREYDRSLRAIRTDRYKYIRGSDGSRELYNVLHDPGETKDLADTRGDVVADLDATLEEWLDSFEHADLSGEVEMPEETKNRLEDLGYLQ